MRKAPLRASWELSPADSRLNTGETGSQLVRRLYASNLNLNSVAGLAGSLATRLQGTQSVTSLVGKPFFFIPYPQYATSLNVLDSNDFSTYHALEVQLQHRFNSGRPFTVFAGTNTVSNVNQSTANCTGCSAGQGTLLDYNGLVWYFSQAQIAQFSAPAAGQMGNTGRNAFVGPHYFELDASFLKRIPVTERIKFEIRADATNLTNTPSFGGPTTDITSSTFGRIRNSLSSGSRKIQLGAKINF